MKTSKFKNTFKLSFLVTAVFLQGCSSVGFDSLTRLNKVDAKKTQNVARHAVTNLSDRLEDSTVGTSSNADFLAARHQAQFSGMVAGRASKPWIGTRTIAIQSDDVLPAAFSNNYQINFDDATGGRVSINVVAERLSRTSGIPVRVKGDVFSGAGATQNSAAAKPPAITTTPIPSPMSVIGPDGKSVGSDPSAKQTQKTYPNPIAIPTTDLNSIEMRWNGSLSGYLDHVTGRLGVSWSYRDGVILIERFITETFEISAFAGSQDFKMSMSGSGSGSSGTGGTSGSSSAGVDVNESGKSESLISLSKTIGSMAAAAPGSTVTLSEGTASLVVTTTKDVMGRIRQVIKRENASLMRSVQLQFDIYSVINNESNESGVDLNLLLESLSKGVAGGVISPASLTTSVAGGLTVKLFNTNNILSKDSSAVVKALADFGTSVQHRPLSLVVMNRQWARKTNLKQTGYLQETTPSSASSTGGGGVPGLKTGTITTGDTLAVQPAILDSGTIILKFGVGLTDLLGLFDVTTGTDSTFQKVQTPEVSGTNDQSTVVLKPGEIMVLTGMSRIRSGDKNRSLGEMPSLLGGSRSASRVREDFVIIVRPVLL